jgi:hypothetical protein
VKPGFFILLVIVAVLAYDLGGRWWQHNKWKRRWSRPDPDRSVEELLDENARRVLSPPIRQTSFTR